MGSKEKENFLKYDSLNEFDDYISKKKNSHRHIHPHVRASILDFEFTRVPFSFKGIAVKATIQGLCAA